MDALLNTHQGTSHSSHISSFCCQPIYLCVSAVPAQVQRELARTFCLVLCYVIILSPKLWSDLVLLSKLSGALGMR